MEYKADIPQNDQLDMHIKSSVIKDIKDRYPSVFVFIFRT